MGYTGNLSERVCFYLKKNFKNKNYSFKVPELFVFYFLTIINFLISLGLITVVWVPISSEKGEMLIGLEIPMQFGLQIFHSLFNFFELIFGFIAIKILGRYQISRFHYKQFEQNDFNQKKNDQDFEWLNELQKNNHIKMRELAFDTKVILIIKHRQLKIFFYLERNLKKLPLNLKHVYIT